MTDTHREPSEACPTCDGSGIYDSPFASVPCPVCKGTGVRPALASQHTPSEERFVPLLEPDDERFAALERDTPSEEAKPSEVEALTLLRQALDKAMEYASNARSGRWVLLDAALYERALAALEAKPTTAAEVTDEVRATRDPATCVWKVCLTEDCRNYGPPECVAFHEGEDAAAQSAADAAPEAPKEEAR